MQKAIKITQLSKDLSMKSKDLLDSLKKYGMEKKTGGSVEVAEWELFLEKLTRENQIENLNEYLDGKATLTVEKTAEEKAEQEAARQAAEEAAHQAEEAKRQAEEAKRQAEARAAEAARKKAEEEARAQARKREEAAQRAARPVQQPARPAQPAKDARPTAARQENRGAAAPHDGRAERGDRRNGSQGNSAYGRYMAQPQENPFAKNMNRPAPAVQQPREDRPAQRAQQEKQERIAKAQAELRQQEQAKAQQQAAERAKAEAAKREERRAQKQQFKTITPTVDTRQVKGGVNIGAAAENTPAPKTRVVDMRTSDVNLSKYDDRFNDQFFAIANGTDTQAAKQKLKKQDNKKQNVKSAKDKQRAAAEKIKRMEAELARKKQLEITVPDEIAVGELAMRLKKTSAEVIKKLMFMGEMKSVNDVVDFATAELIADEFGAKVTKEIVVTIEEKLFTEAEDREEDLIERAPVVCVMGHVDHGKTSILDAIRHTNVTKGEAGGITQAIGAYRVKVNDKDVTFLDTPGHEAFTAMRMRGAKSTDIAILVVAADDGVMPQTIEAINHAKAAGIDIIVAINKMDKPQANPDNVLNQLTQYELVPEAWGGDVICVPVSALTGMGMNNLLESVLLVAEVKELKANPARRAKGIVIESRLDRGQGSVATILVQNGTLHQGDYVIVGNAVGRVRSMKDDKGRTIKSAGPSVPVEITGLDDVPQAGDELNAVEDERMAKSLAEQRRSEMRQEILAANARVNLDDLFSQIAGGVQTLNIIVKADVAGSAEAVKASLVKLSNEEVKVSVIHTAVGGITESDVMLAAASNAIIVGFNVRPDKNALDSAERNNVDIRTHRIIYEIIDEVEAAMKGLLAPTYKEVILGHAQVRQTIHVPNVGTIAGSYIQDGKVTRQSQIRIVRDGIVIFEDKISSLRRFKDDVKEVNDGYECGIGLEKFNDIKENDILEAFIMEEVER